MVSEIQRIDLGFVNCYLIKTDSGFVLIDTGISRSRGRLESALSSAGCKPGDLKLILLTHGDIDHSGNCAYLKRKYGAPIAMSRFDSGMVENGDMNPKREVRSAAMRVLHFFMWLSGISKKMIGGFERFRPDLYLDDGQSLASYGLDAIVLRLPGHTQGSVGVHFHTGDLVCGDTLQNGGKPGTTMIVQNNADLEASLRRLSKLTVRTVYPGHGRPFPWVQFAARRG